MSQSSVYQLLAVGIMCAIFTGKVYGDCSTQLTACQAMMPSGAAQDIQAGELQAYCKAVNKVMDCYSAMDSTCLGGSAAFIDNAKSTVDSMCKDINGGKNRVESSVLVLVVAVIILPALGLLAQ